MTAPNRILKLWQTLDGKPGGRWLFSRAVCFKAPYFASIAPRIEVLAPGHARVSIRKRRAVLNHIGTVHAIALCNMAEIAGGLMTDVTIPGTHRWIPKGMTVEYLAKAETDVTAIARPESDPDPARVSDYPVVVEVHDTADTLVFWALITMWMAPKKQA